jgi:hypothetical protein
MNMSNSADQWLIRTAENQITGPFTRNQVCQFIQQGKLQLNDEVCNANTFWVYLHEHDEIKKQLGIEVPRHLYTNPQEVTLTQTDTDVERTDPGLEPVGSRVAAMGTGSSLRGVVRKKENEQVPELSDAFEDVGEDKGDYTAVLDNRAFRDFRQKKKPAQAAASETPIPSAPFVERSKVAHFLTYLLMIGAVGLLIAVIKMLHNQPTS